MIIDNIFSIKPYLGSTALPLLNPPSGLLSNTTYTTFMNNIVAVYGTQSVDGSIPVFYKTGNSANVQSTLSALEPRQSYYFVSRNNVTLPYSIPFSGTLLSFSSPSTCTAIDIVPDRVTMTSGSGNYYFYNQNLTNLTVGEPYSYGFKILHSNWPVTIVPMSGVVQSSQSTNNFGAVVRFDSDAGVTNYANFLPQGTDLAQLDKKNLFAMVEVSVQPPASVNCPKVVDVLTLVCNQCVPLPSPSPTPTPTPTPTPAPLFNTTLTFNGSTVGTSGVNFGNATVGDTLEFTTLANFTGTPATTTITIGGNVVAIVSITSDYVGSLFRFTKASTGIKYVGTFLNGTASF